MNYQRLLQQANMAMLISLLMGLMAAYAAYGITSLPIAVLVVAHLSIMLLATAFKISYVIRLISQRSLGIPVN